WRIAHLAMTPAPDRKLNWGVWVSEHGQSRKLFQLDSVLRLVGWSPSGQDLLVESVAGQRDATLFLSLATVGLMQISVNDGSARVIASLGNAYFSNLSLSPDGRTVAFAAREGDEDVIKVIPATGGNSRKLAASGDPNIYLSNLVWSPDGKTIY